MSKTSFQLISRRQCREFLRVVRIGSQRLLLLGGERHYTTIIPQQEPRAAPRVPNLGLHWFGPLRTTPGTNGVSPSSTTTPGSIQTPKVDIQHGGDIIHRLAEEVAIVLHVVQGAGQFLYLQMVTIQIKFRKKCLFLVAHVQQPQTLFGIRFSPSKCRLNLLNLWTDVSGTCLKLDSIYEKKLSNLKSSTFLTSIYTSLQ